MKKITLIVSVFLVILSLTLVISAFIDLDNIREYKNEIAFLNTVDNTKFCANDITEKKSEDDRPTHAITNNKNDEYKVAYWNQLGLDEIYNDKLYRGIMTPIVTVNGSIETLFDTKMVLESSAKNCIIGYETAFRLFGGQNVRGLSIIYNDEQYTIIDILENEKEVFIYSDNPNKRNLGRATIKNNNPQAKTKLTNEFREKYLLNDVFDYEIYIFIAEFLIFIFCVIFVIFMFSMLKLVVLRQVSKNNMWIFRWGIRVAMISIIIISGIVLIDYPMNMLPGKLSDFIFWKQMFNEKKYNISLLLTENMTVLDMNFIELYLRYLTLTIAGIICVTSSILCFRNISVLTPAEMEGKKCLK